MLNINNKPPMLPGLVQRLALEGPSSSGKGNHMVCDFHLTTYHDGNSCPEMTRFMQMLSMNEHADEPLIDEDTIVQPGDDSVNFLE